MLALVSILSKHFNDDPVLLHNGITEQLLAALVENSPDAILARNVSKKIISWNKGAENLLGYTKEEALGKTAYELGIIQFTGEEMAELDEVLEASSTWKAEKEYHHKSGAKLIGAVTANAFKNDCDQITTVLFIIKDITRQKQLENDLKKLNEQLEERIQIKTREITASEKRFRAITENNHDSIVMFDHSRNIIYRSPAAMRITGWTNEEAMQPGFISKITHPDDKEKFQGYIQEAMLNPGRIINTSCRIYHRNGNIIFMEGTLVNLLEDGVQALVLDNRDVTERIQKAEELEKNRCQLEEREKQLDLYIKYSPAAIAMFDNKMQYLVASRRWLNDFNLNEKEIIGKSQYEIFPEITQNWKDIHQRCLNGAVEKKEEDLFIRADGGHTWLRWEVRPWYQSSGDVGGIIIFSEDITQRKVAEETVIRNEEKYRSLVERISDGFVAVDEHWNFTYVNPVAEKILNHPVDQLIGKNVWKEFPQSMNTPFYHAYHEAMREQKHICIEDYSITVNSWVRVNIYPSPTGLSVFFKDISKEVESETKARKSEELRKTIMASALDAIVCIDSNSDIIYWNNQSEKLFGWSETEALGSNISDTIIPEKWRKHHQDGLQKYIQSGQGHMMNRLIETTAVDKNGNEFAVEIFIVPVKDNDNLTFYSFMRDISKRKKAEEEIKRNQVRMKQAQEIAHLGNWEIDFRTNKSNWSDEAYRIYGLTPADQNISEEEWLTTYVHPDDRERVRAENENGKLGWKGASFCHRIICPDGSIRHVYAESRYELDDDGNPYAIYGITHDITDLISLKEELQVQQRNEQLKLTAVTLEAQEKERNAIGRELHDNVNQIIAGTKIILSTIKSDSPRIIETVKSCCGYLEQAVTENRKIAHELSSPDFGDKSLVDGITDVTNIMLRSARMDVRLDTSGLDEKLISDKLKLTLFRIVQEQCTNIVKYSEASEVGISFSSDKNFLKMVIADDGKGMDPQKKSDGIGLKNIKSRLSIFEGFAEIQTAPGKGFTLNITVPLAKQLI